MAQLTCKSVTLYFDNIIINSVTIKCHLLYNCFLKVLGLNCRSRRVWGASCPPGMPRSHCCQSRGPEAHWNHSRPGGRHRPIRHNSVRRRTNLLFLPGSTWLPAKHRWKWIQLGGSSNCYAWRTDRRSPNISARASEFVLVGVHKLHVSGVGAFGLLGQR